MSNAGGLKDDAVFVRRQLNVQRFDDLTLLEVVAHPNGKNRVLQLFFSVNAEVESLGVGDGLKILDSRSVGGAPVLTCSATGANGPEVFTLNNQALEIQTCPAETDLFAGRNVIFAVRNHETVAATLEWLQYHVDLHGMDAALILNRSQPGKDQGYAKQLETGVAKITGLKRLVLLDADFPLGQENLPPKAHPFNVPGAPGKDRMELPASDAWSAPLGYLAIYELARSRFLRSARAVANIDVCDLLVPDEGENIFDLACHAKGGLVSLTGAQAYPWRTRKGQLAGFGDHICVQFDSNRSPKRWCVSPEFSGENTVWRLIRVVGTEPDPLAARNFIRHMALRHPTESVSKIVPKTSLIENEFLLEQASGYFSHKPVRMPKVELAGLSGNKARTTIVTTMKNEGPFILEWIAYHRMIGVNDFLVYTNDCTDGTDTMLQLLQEKGIVQYRENPFPGTKFKPQQAALMAADKEPIVRNADWLICMDVDEYINIHTGEGRLEDLFAAVKDANMIAITWRLFGNNDIHEFEDTLLCEAFTRCAPELIRKPHQAWGFKTLYRNQSIFKKMGVHRPKGLKPQLWESINWVNGSGEQMPSNMFRNGWRSTTTTYGYDLVTLNHYAVRSAESFLVKRDRGRVNHVERDQGLAYWFRMNNNAEENRSIQRMLPALRTELDSLLEDPEIAAAHEYSVDMHRLKIKELKSGENYSNFYDELTGQRMERLSRLHAGFGANVFLAGPSVVPDEIVDQDPGVPFTFTVKRGATSH